MFKKILFGICACVFMAVLTLPGVSLNVLASDITEVSFGDLVKDGREFWEGNHFFTLDDGDVVVFDDNKLEFRMADIKCGSNRYRQYENLSLSISLTVTWPGSAADWGTIITMRDKGGIDPVWVAGRGNCYSFMFSLNDDGDSFLMIRRHNWDDPGVEDETLINVQLDDDLNGVQHDWVFSVYDNDDGVVILASMDGYEYANLVDESPHAIKGPGYISITNHGPRTFVAEGEISQDYSRPSLPSEEPTPSEPAHSEPPAPSQTPSSPSPSQSVPPSPSITPSTAPVTDELSGADEDNGGGLGTGLIIVIVVAAVIIIVAAVVIVINKRKQK